MAINFFCLFKCQTSVPHLSRRQKMTKSNRYAFGLGMTPTPPPSASSGLAALCSRLLMQRRMLLGGDGCVSLKHFIIFFPSRSFDTPETYTLLKTLHKDDLLPRDNDIMSKTYSVLGCMNTYENQTFLLQPGIMFLSTFSCSENIIRTRLASISCLIKVKKRRFHL